MNAENILKLYEFAISTRDEFLMSPNVMPELKIRAQRYEGGYVIWDPIGNEGGYLLVGDDRDTLCKSSVEFLELSR